MPAKEKKKKSKIKRIAIIVMVLVIALLLATGVWAVLEYRGTLSGSEATVEIRPGASTMGVALTLKEKGVINSVTLFNAISKIQGMDEQWQAGTFAIPAKNSYGKLFSQLSAPQTAALKVSIPEGKQVKQIASLYEEAGICSAVDFLAACDLKKYDYDFLNAITARSDLEGYLFPDTYYFNENTKAEIIIDEMLANFQERLYTAEYRQRATDLGYTFDEMVTLASIIESEAATKSDRYRISGAFHNRLNNPGLYPKLQSCVTVEYAMGIKKTIISLADTKFESPYNTYLYPGLPIGPICCPSEMSLQAALYPEANEYYYFQSDESGTIHFAETYGEHAVIQKDVQSDWHPQQ